MTKITEAEFQQRVIDLARLRGWLVYHQRPAMMRSGKWATALQGDAGFPDLVLLRGKQLIFAELKSERGKLSEAQERWIQRLVFCSNERLRVFMWKPNDWDTIVEILDLEEPMTTQIRKRGSR